MTCARVLPAFGSHRQPAVTPVDLAVCLGLSQRRPLLGLPVKPAPRRRQQTCLQSHRLSSASSSPSYSPSPPPPSLATSEPRSCFRRYGGASKKRVVFADAKGLALAVVRLFIPEPSNFASTLEMRPSFSRLQSQLLPSDKLQHHRLRLGFPQPAIASQSSPARQQYPCVQLESCNVSEHSLSGTVRVNHVSVEKAVHVRVTFDSWRSHHDIHCILLQQQQQQRFGGSNEDLFAFDLSLPKNIDPAERVEFCVVLTPGNDAMPQWDDNRGQNYRLIVETGGSNGPQGDCYRFQPTLSQYRSPLWPLYVSPSFRGVHQAPSEQR
ncbi:protein phosphatase 1 regulatory subunit 3C-B [Pungitius pungitius]|uniref:protein phosphatase 1 regulatory subunit 3C-B n=1 Tax=Pungitius pungitius TaxID=134920 RepID=UPI002E111CFF